MSDFEINKDMINTEFDTDIVDEQIAEATHRLAREREKLLALAFVRGYDGVDIHMKDMVHTDPDDYSMGFEYEAWKGEPPTLDRFGSGVQRYDFTALTKREQQMLASYVGVTDLEEIDQ